ncbi:YkgJ family cysteine cluster protein [Anaerovibrio slackiae]|uniref:YkgJ family cysteine cluster protein n=1 Tax=Anaerovibrio slackiae TaxID=2652309 RepID=UPI003862F256
MVDKFKCDMCGLCCQNVGSFDIYRHLDRGDGICLYYDEPTHKCKIYHNRPLICNVDEYYDKKMHHIMAKNHYYELNYKMCDYLKSL